MRKGVKIGEKYYSIRILPDKAEPFEYTNQNDELYKLVLEFGNCYKTKKECQLVCDIINKAINNNKGD